MLKRRFEILLPLEHSDGTGAAQYVMQTRDELVAEFGKKSVLPPFIYHVWPAGGPGWNNEMVLIITHVEDSAANLQFFRRLKEKLRERFKNLEIYIVSYLVEVL